MRQIYRLAVCLGAGLVAATTVAADQQENVDRLNVATEVFRQIMAVPDKGIPQDLIERAQCVVIVPGVKKGAFIVGGECGKATSRAANTVADGRRRERSSSREAASASRSAERRPTW